LELNFWNCLLEHSDIEELTHRVAKVSAEVSSLAVKEASEKAWVVNMLKAKQVKQMKKTLDKYLMSLTNVLGTPKEDEETKSTHHKTVRITVNDMDAGTRVLSIEDTHGSSTSHDTIVLTQDLSHLESKMAVVAMVKQFPEDAENAIVDVDQKQEQEQQKQLQPLQQKEPTVYWGDDKDDEIFHAGVSNMVVRMLRDSVVDTEIVADSLKDGATQLGNATALEMQFVTSQLFAGEALVTESVVQTGCGP
jgi:hypothetical protein